MVLQQSFVPELISKKGNQACHNLISIAVGVLLLIVTAQISFTLPFTPVPITGQTFGVALISLLWGKTRGMSSVAIYLYLGASGLPVFALGKSGMNLGPTSGYLLGMLIASYVMGTMADSGWTRSYLKTWFAAFIGSCITFMLGVLVMALFVPKEKLILMGVLPFLPGDFIKTILVCSIVRGTKKTIE